MFEQINRLDIPYINEEVKQITVEGNNKIIKTINNVFVSKKLIIALGRHPRKLSIDNIDDLVGRGVSYCAVCDGAFYKDKTVAVVGGGNAAVEEGCYLTKFAKKVYIIQLMKI